MPFLRVIRDKRGYETTYLMHWYREGSRQRSRILYIFRTPGGVRVGRESLEPEVLRDIETHHPDIAFDWKAVLDHRQVVESAPEPRRLRARRRSDDERAPAAAGATSASPETASREETGSPAPSRSPIPSAIEGATPDEQIAFLATWYPIVRERIPQRTADPIRQEALLALSERLNPAAWTDADQIAMGLQHAADALERLSRVFSRRRRRSRRPATSSGRPASADDGASNAAVEPTQGDGGRADPLTDPSSSDV